MYTVRRREFVEVEVGVWLGRLGLDNPVLSGFCQVRCISAFRDGVTYSVSRWWAGIVEIVVGYGFVVLRCPLWIMCCVRCAGCLLEFDGRWVGKLMILDDCMLF